MSFREAKYRHKHSRKMTENLDLYQLLIKDIPAAPKPPFGFLELCGSSTNETVNSTVYSRFLNPSINREVSTLFLTALTELIKEKCGKELSVGDVNVSTEVITEEGKRIDIYINDPTNQTTIIIENKLNHHLNNDLSSYWRHSPYSDEQKAGIILTLEQLSVPIDYQDSYINIRHIELVQHVEQSGLPAGIPQNYYQYINDFINTIKYLSNNIEMNESAKFYFNHADAVNKAMHTHEAATEYIDQQLQIAAAELDFTIATNSKGYKVFHLDKEVTDIFYTVVFESLFTDQKQLIIILELAGDLLENRSAFRRVYLNSAAKNLLQESNKSWKTHAHFLYANYAVTNNELSELSQFVVDKIRTYFEPLISEFQKAYLF